MLDLEEWLSLTSLPDAVCELRELRSLQLHNCTSLERLPLRIGQLTKLENLDLGADPRGSYAWCARSADAQAASPCLSELPPSLSELISLTEIDLSGTRLPSLPACVGELPSLKRLNMTGCAELHRLCEALPAPLEALTLNGCHRLVALPHSLSLLLSLQQLHLNDCGALTAVPDVSRLSELTALSLVGCGGLRAMPAGLHELLGCCVTFDDGDVVVGSS